MTPKTTVSKFSKPGKIDRSARYYLLARVGSKDHFDRPGALYIKASFETPDRPFVEYGTQHLNAAECRTLARYLLRAARVLEELTDG